MQLFFNAVILYVNRYYHNVWLNENISRQAPQKMKRSLLKEASVLRHTIPTWRKTGVSMEYARFSSTMGIFDDPDSLSDRGFVNPKYWWVLYGSSTLNLQALALKFLGQPYSFSCCERNWSTYSFILKEEQINTGTGRKSSVCA